MFNAPQKIVHFEEFYEYLRRENQPQFEPDTLCGWIKACVCVIVVSGIIAAVGTLIYVYELPATIM